MKIIVFTSFCFLALLANLKAQTYKMVPIGSFQVFFETAKHDLNEQAISLIDSLANVMKNDDQLGLELQGHTDSKGSVEYNEQLSKRRVMAILKQMEIHQLNPLRFKKLAFGERRLAVKETEENDRALNRRVQLILVRRQAVLDIKGQIVDDSTGQPLQARIYVQGLNYSDSTQTDSQGKYALQVPKELDGHLTIRAKSYFFDQLELKTIAINPDITQDIKLQKLKINKKLKIKNIYFHTNKYQILDQSLPALKELELCMLENPSLVIEIQGHINHANNIPVLKNTWMFKLSEDRAKAIYNHLIDLGVSAKRMSHKGFGNFFMVYTNPNNEEEMEANRRVEIFIKKI